MPTQLYNRYGGGVAIYIKDHLSHVVRNDIMSDITIELITVELKLVKQKPLVITCWYRPPNSLLETFNAFDCVMQRLDESYNDYVVIGDMNCDVINPCKSWQTKKLLGIMETYNCTQFITHPTRITKTSSTAIDLIFTNAPSKFASSGVHELAMTDHYMIYCVFGKSQTIRTSQIHKCRVVRSYKKFNEEGFRNDIESVVWDPVYEASDPESMYDKFISLLNSVIDRHTPMRRVRVKQNESPWMTSDLLTMIRERDKLKVKAKKSKLTSDWENYKKSRNNVTTCIRQAKCKFITKKIETADNCTKEIWQSLRYIVPGKKTDSQIASISVGDEIVDGQNLANLFNDFFVNIGQNLEKENPNVTETEEYNCTAKVKSTFSLHDVEISEVCNILKSLPLDRATGPDYVPAKLLKCIASLIAPPLTSIINKSFQMGSIPAQWKEARVTPIYKGGCKDDVGNFRPISVIPILGKVMEKVAYIQLQAYLTDNDILTHCQFGFRPKHSTQSALLNVTENWLENIDKGSILVGVVMIDLKKAFDTVNHRILIRKLGMYGFDKPTLKWFENYLSNRRQFTCVNGYMSDKKAVTCGVPQGSLLGPLLFSLYVNDFPSIIKHSELSLYADDTCLFSSSKSPEEVTNKLNEDLICVSRWLKENRLFINKKKCELMFLGIITPKKIRITIKEL